MKISELIEELQKIKEQYGNIEVETTYGRREKEHLFGLWREDEPDECRLIIGD